MKKQMIISIGREFGSGGHEVAEIISNDLQIPLYDRSLLDGVAAKAGLEVGFVEKYDEKRRNPFLSRKVRGHSNSIEDAIAELQFEYIREKALSGESFVIVGRCADVVLEGNAALVSVFVLGDKHSKIERVMKKYGLTEREALIKMKRHDTKRKAYHNTHSRIKWGDSRRYDLCINSSRLGVVKTARIIEEFAFERVGRE